MKVESQWYDIYDTRMLNPFPGLTKKLIMDFNKEKCEEKKKQSLSTKPSRKKTIG